MAIAPVIQRLHPELDARQREVVCHTDGPLVGVAGPGSGKTRCIERRAVNLLLLGEVCLDELVLCTFGRDVAVELGQRFSASAQTCGIAVRLSPNPPKDTDGRREDSGRWWVRELQGRWPGVLG